MPPGDAIRVVIPPQGLAELAVQDRLQPAVVRLDLTMAGESLWRRLPFGRGFPPRRLVLAFHGVTRGTPEA